MLCVLVSIVNRYPSVVPDRSERQVPAHMSDTELEYGWKERKSRGFMSGFLDKVIVGIMRLYRHI